MKAAHRLQGPHQMYEYGPEGPQVWGPELLPLIKRYYAAGKRGSKNRGPNYSSKNWMESGRYDGGLSITDVARLWQLSPVGVLFAIWAHSAASGDPSLPPMEERVGFTIDLDKPATMRQYLPEGTHTSKDFHRALALYRLSKKNSGVG